MHEQAQPDGWPSSKRTWAIWRWGKPVPQTIPIQFTWDIAQDQDQLGSVRDITNSNGTVSNSYSYDAYGNTTASSGSVLNQFKYAGEYQDAESSLYYLRARYYARLPSNS